MRPRCGRIRRLANAVLGDDVDHAADRAVAVKHSAAVAPGDFDSLDAIARDRAEVEPGEVEIVETPSVHQHQHVRRRVSTETAHVDRAAVPLTPPNRLTVWIPASRDRISCSVISGARAMSSR